MAVEKLFSRKFRKIKIALGCPTSDVLNFLDILHPSNFGCFARNWTFSTPTGDCTQVHRRMKTIPAPALVREKQVV
jgi:hypothetical protein